MVILDRVWLDGAILSLIATLMILVSMAYNPRIWLNDYPPSIKQMVEPKTARERQIGLWFGIPFMLVLFGGPLISTILLKQQAGDQATFLTYFVNATGVAFFFNLVDLLIVDWLMFCLITPRFIIIPGTEGAPGYKDYGFHFRGFLIGTVFSIIAGLITAGIVMLLP